MNLSENVWLGFHGQQQGSQAASIWLSRLQAGFDRIGHAWEARRDRARNASKLSALSDRVLWDMGLSRSDIPRIAKGTYRRD
jgi:uncharacterized protein YjiS (DUF1127 family)